MDGLAHPKKISKIISADDGQRRSRAGADDKELRPAEHETGKRAETLGDIGIFASGRRNPRAQLGVDEPAHEDKRASQKPKGNNRRKRTQVARHLMGRRINSGADGNADKDGDSVKNPQRFEQGWLAARNGRRILLAQT